MHAHTHTSKVKFNNTIPHLLLALQQSYTHIFTTHNTYMRTHAYTHTYNTYPHTHTYKICSIIHTTLQINLAHKATDTQKHTCFHAHIQNSIFNALKSIREVLITSEPHTYAHSYTFSGTTYIMQTSTHTQAFIRPSKLRIMNLKAFKEKPR